jgi:hypothetical protein
MFSMNALHRMRVPVSLRSARASLCPLPGGISRCSINPKAPSIVSPVARVSVGHAHEPAGPDVSRIQLRLLHRDVSRLVGEAGGQFHVGCGCDVLALLSLAARITISNSASTRKLDTNAPQSPTRTLFRFQEPDMSLDGFFSRYAELSLGPQPEALTGLYGPTFIVAGPHGSQAFTNDVRFVEWLRQVANFNREHGMRSLTATSIRDTTLSPLHTLATVTWGARFEKTGDRTIEFEISYLLEKAEAEWRILSYVSRDDQNAAMKKEGLL